MTTSDCFPIHEVPKVRTYTEQEVGACKSLGDAYDATMRLSGLARKQIASQSGIAIETLSAMCSGARNIPAAKMLRFYEVCQNLYALQWLALQFGKTFSTPLTVEEKAALYDHEHRKTA